ncbi:MAG TPA: PIG-L family deacetylase [Mycobacteriales bacterium]
MPHTLVVFHAHPDDEALLTGGTMASAAAAGHRVVVVFATDGGAGLASSAYGSRGGMGPVRRIEAQSAARVLGAGRVEFLGYSDSGMAGEPSGLADPFSAADPDEAAERLAAVLRDERADVVTSYDPAGGYGHPDHVQVHRVGARAAALAGTPVLLEATVDRTALRRVLRLVSRLPGLPAGFDPRVVDRAYTPRGELTHRVDVRAFTGPKRAAMTAHASQATADQGTRTLQVLLRLPGPVFDLVVGHEWFRQPGRVPPRRPLGDVFAGLYG